MKPKNEDPDRRVSVYRLANGYWGWEHWCGSAFEHGPWSAQDWYSARLGSRFWSTALEEGLAHLEACADLHKVSDNVVSLDDWKRKRHERANHPAS